jgi:hypothetical protein
LNKITEVADALKNPKLKWYKFRVETKNKNYYLKHKLIKELDALTAQDDIIFTAPEDITITGLAVEIPGLKWIQLNENESINIAKNDDVTFSFTNKSVVSFT